MLNLQYEYNENDAWLTVLSYISNKFIFSVLTGRMLECNIGSTQSIRKFDIMTDKIASI